MKAQIEKLQNELNELKVKYESSLKDEYGSALIKEAEKVGFKPGVKIISVVGTEGILTNGSLSYRKSEDKLVWNDGEYYIFHNGKWAEIIKDERIKIDSYEVVFHIVNKSPAWNGGVTLINHTSIDCNPFFKEFWQAAKVISEHSKAKMMIGCSKQLDVSLETINKILDKL